MADMAMVLSWRPMVPTKPTWNATSRSSRIPFTALMQKQR